MFDNCWSYCECAAINSQNWSAWTYFLFVSFIFYWLKIYLSNKPLFFCSFFPYHTSLQNNFQNKAIFVYFCNKKKCHAIGLQTNSCAVNQDVAIVMQQHIDYIIHKCFFCLFKCNQLKILNPKIFAIHELNSIWQTAIHNPILK